MKLIVIGRRGVGKTNLLNALIEGLAFKAQDGGDHKLQIHKTKGDTYIETPGIDGSLGALEEIIKFFQSLGKEVSKADAMD